MNTLTIGQRVLAEDPQTGKIETDVVQVLIADPVSALMALQLSDGSTITETVDHSFWVDFGPMRGLGGWMPAGDLRVGDRLHTASGLDVRVVSLRYHVGKARVSTLTVARDHTFFVGTARVLVHNCDVAAQIDGLLQTATRTATNRSVQYEKSGGFDQAVRDFEHLAEGRPIRTYPNGVQAAELGGGIAISVRSHSSAGSPTLQINQPGRRPIKSAMFLERNLLQTVPPSPLVEQLRQHVDAIVQLKSTGGFTIAKQDRWVAVPVESSGHFCDRDRAELINAARTWGTKALHAFMLEYQDEFPAAFAVPVSIDGLAAFDQTCGLFNVVLVGDDVDWLVVCTTDDYFVLLGPPRFVRHALATTLQHGYDEFEYFAASPAWRDPLRRFYLGVLRALQREYVHARPGTVIEVGGPL